MIHVHFGFYFAVLGLVVGLSRGVGLPRGGFAIMAGLGLRPACLWGAVCGQDYEYIICQLTSTAKFL